ncbi:hypothetical protein ACLMJK_005166 [Lecanora helva]
MDPEQIVQQSAIKIVLGPQMRAQTTVNRFLTPEQVPRVRYVLWNIYQINNLFNTYYTALQNAVNNVQSMITSLTTTVDLIKRPSVTFFDILSALTMGLVFLGVPAIFDTIPTMVVKEIVPIAQGFVLGLTQTPGTFRALWPQGDVMSQTFQIGQLNENLDFINNQSSAMLNDALATIMNNAGTFISFAGYGRYSGATKVSIPDDTDDISFALKNYLTSISLKENGWYAYVGRNISLLGSGCLPVQDTNFFECPSMFLWMSPQNYRQYSFFQRGNGKSNARKLFQQLLSLGYVEMPTLVEGAYNCTAKAGGPLINVDFENGSIDTSCISQMPIYVSKGTCPPDAVKMPDGSCPFGSITDTYKSSTPPTFMRNWGGSQGVQYTSDS